jgi:hypothetical protein
MSRQFARHKPPVRWRSLVALVLAAGAVLAPPPPPAPAESATPIPPRVQSAVDRGLEWLARSQDRDGSWSAGRGGAGGHAAAVTGLAAMAFMARGHVPGQGPYGDALNRAVDFILTTQQADGVFAARSISQPMYDHGICTIMLCEAYGMLDDRRQELARAAIAKGVRLILTAQAVRKPAENQGGWRYEPTTEQADLSVSGWQLMALRAAANVGAAVPKAAIDSGIAYVKRRARADGGFEYIGNGQVTTALTGTGVLALALMGQQDAAEVKRGGSYLRTHPASDRTNHYFYTIYYCAQAAWQLGGDYWTQIGKGITDDLVAKQRADGSWPVSGSEGQGGESYGTAMAVLALTVPYRYLPIYQR